MLQNINSIDHFLKENEKSNWINERNIRWKNLDKTFWAKTYNFLIDDGNGDKKKAKCTKKYVIKKTLRIK